MNSILSSANLASKKESWKLFNQIAPTYDFLNRLLSAGIDRHWRRKVARLLPIDEAPLRVLDLATGTGEQLLTLLAMHPDKITSATGADLSEGMLALARTKSLPTPTCAIPNWVHASAESLPFPEESFETVTISFGIRNVENTLLGLKEIFRVLTPGGTALILEFSLPTNFFFRQAYLFYFRHLLPRIGGWVSGKKDAYRYLNTTVEDFPYGQAFLLLLQEAGFKKTRAIPLTFGIASIYIAEKKIKKTKESN